MKQPNDFASMMGYAVPTAVNPLTGQPDHLSAMMQTPGAANMNYGDAAPGSGSIWDSFFNKTENGITDQGWGGMALGAGSALMNGVLGFKQYGVAKDTLNQNKRQFDLNFGAQQKMTNSRLADRQAARVAASPGTGTYQSVGDYMKQYGV